MTPDLWLALVQFATKFGLDAALAIINGIKGGKTIDDAIAALELAKLKMAQEYLKEAAAAIAPAPVVTPPADPPPAVAPAPVPS
jgi:hypothetical protein